MSEAVQQGAGQPLRAEDLGPLVEGQVGGDQDRPSLVSLAEDLEEELRAGLGEWDEAKLVDDQQLESGQLLLEVEQSSLVPGLDQLVDQRGGRREADRQPPLAGGESELYYIRGVESWSLFGLGRLVGRPPGAPSSPHLPPASPRPPAQPPIQAARRAADRRRTSPRLRRGSPPAARPQPRGPRPWCTFSMDGLPASQRPVAETLLSRVVVSSRPSS